MFQNNDKIGQEETAKVFDTVMNGKIQTEGVFVPIPVTCPKCDNYKDNTRIGIDVKVTGMPKRELYKCGNCGELFNNPPQSSE